MAGYQEFQQRRKIRRSDNMSLMSTIGGFFQTSQVNSTSGVSNGSSSASALANNAANTALGPQCPDNTIDNGYVCILTTNAGQNQGRDIPSPVQGTGTGTYTLPEQTIYGDPNAPTDDDGNVISCNNDGPGHATCGTGPDGTDPIVIRADGGNGGSADPSPAGGGNTPPPSSQLPTPSLVPPPPPPPCPDGTLDQGPLFSDDPDGPHSCLLTTNG
jgi:hypothetical protein